MGKRSRFHDHPDPEYQRWGRKYPRFPGVAECVNLIRNRKALGAWADIIVQELTEHAESCLPEMIETFRSCPSEDVRLYLMMALDMARLPEAVPFLAQVLRDGDPNLTHYAERALMGINTPEARTVLWEITHG